MSSTQHCLPQLASYVDTSHPLYTQGKSTKALAAVTALHKLHAVRKLGPSREQLQDGLGFGDALYHCSG